MSRSPARTDDVQSYYSEMVDQFRYVWSSEEYNSIHNGYYDERADEKPATTVMNSKLADTVDIDWSDRVLNIGCGAGGDAVWLACQRDAEVVGVDLCEPFLDDARAEAASVNADDLLEFRQDDYHDLSTVDDDAFDVVWALESVCHSFDDRAVIDECKRVLTEGGRIVVGDLFVHGDELSGSDRKRLDKLNDRLRCEFSDLDAFESVLSERGFSDIVTDNVTSSVRPGIKDQYRSSLFTLPLLKILVPLGIASESHSDLIHGAYHEYKLLDSGGIGFYIISATVPET